MTGKGGYIYIVSNKTRSVLYIGVTSNLAQRTFEHKDGRGSLFTSKYNCTDLVYYEFYETIDLAILREKRLKKWKREWKNELIKKLNPYLKDLYEEVRDYR
jgi:putative endonuclease